MDEVRKIKGASIYSLKNEIEERAKDYIKWNNSYISYDDEIIWEKLVNIGISKIDEGLWFYDRWETSMRSELEGITGIKYKSIDYVVKSIWREYFCESEYSYNCIHVYDYAYKHSSKTFRLLSSKFVQIAIRVLLAIIAVVFLFEVLGEGGYIENNTLGVVFMLIISWTPIIIMDSCGDKYHSFIPLCLYLSMLLMAELKAIFFSNSLGCYACVESIHEAAWFFPILLLTPIYYFDKRKYYVKEK